MSETNPSARVAIVTGAGSGIGQAVSLSLLRDGWAVVLAGRRLDALSATVGMAPAGARTLAVPTDVSDPASVRSLFERTKSSFGRLDLLFNNAGIGAPAIATRRSDLRAVEEGRRCEPDRRVSLHAGSVQDHEDPDAAGRTDHQQRLDLRHAPRPNSAPYTATKHAITGLTKSTSLDGRKYDIACGQIDIGNAATEMTARMTDGVPQASGTIAVEPTMDVDYVAQAVLYMASLPLEANVLFMTVMATQMPLVGRG